MTNPLEQDWASKAKALTLNTQAFINGSFQDAASGETFTLINPANGEQLTEVCRCGPDDVDAAVKAARESFESGSWANQSPQQRKAVLNKVAQLIEANREELALLETLDMGKNIRDSFNLDIPKSAESFYWYAEAIDKVYGEVSSSNQGKLGIVTQEPLGVVAAIIPWNFPLLMAAWKLAPAMAAGNSVILKPSERSSLTAIKLAEIMQSAGIPDGVFNVLPGFGHDLGQALALHMDVDCLVFTGSTATGKRLMEYSGQSNMKKVYTECGGKSPNIIFADAQDLDKVCQGSANAIFFNQGEVCVAGSRLLVEQSIAASVTEKLVALAAKMQPGDPLNPLHYMGPLVDAAHLKQVEAFIHEAKAQGAILECGGEAILT